MFSKNILKQYKSSTLVTNALRSDVSNNKTSLFRFFSNKSLLLNKTDDGVDGQSDTTLDGLSDNDLLKTFNSYSGTVNVSKQLLNNLDSDTKDIIAAKTENKSKNISDERTMNVYKSYQEELAESFKTENPKDSSYKLQKDSRGKSSHLKGILKRGNLVEAMEVLVNYSTNKSYCEYFLNEDYTMYTKELLTTKNMKALNIRKKQYFGEFEEEDENFLSGIDFWNLCKADKEAMPALEFLNTRMKAIYLQQVVFSTFEGEIPELISSAEDKERLEKILKAVTEDGIITPDDAEVFSYEQELSPEVYKILYLIPDFKKHLKDEMKKAVKLDLESIQNDQSFLIETGLLSPSSNENGINETAYSEFVDNFMKKHAHLKRKLLQQEGNEVFSGHTIDFLNDDVKSLKLSQSDKFEILKFLIINKKDLIDDSWIEHFVSIDTHGVFGIYKCIPYENEELKNKFSYILESLNLRRQLEIENACSRNGVELEMLKRKNNFGTKTMQFGSLDLLTRWQLELASALDNNKHNNLGSTDSDLKKYEILNELSSESIAIIAIFTFIKDMTFYKNKSDLDDLSRDYSLGVSQISKSIGEALTFEFSRSRLGEEFFKENKKRRTPLQQRYYESMVNRNKTGVIPSEIKEQVEIDLGATVLDLILSNCTIKAKNVNTNEILKTAAFNRTYANTEDGIKGILTLHPIVVKKLAIAAPKFETTMQALPMLRKPRDWTDGSDGGYLSSRTLLLRLQNNREQQFHLKKSFRENPDLSQDILEGVNTLSRTAWTINQKVYEVVTKIWNSGKEFASIPPANFHEITDYKNPKNIFYNKLNDDTISPGEKRYMCVDLLNLRQKYLSIRSTEAYKLVLSQSYMGERFYFPHTLDFRGRAYPINVYLNQLGNDLSRGLLLFWEGKKLGPDGLDWLMIHLGNTCGLSKKSFADRIAFSKENLEEFRKDVENPHRSDAFWLKAEDPFQCLSAIFEIVSAYDCPEGIENYVCHLPVHQDGSCNGLQHYAALGRDKSGAKEVNLLPSDVPQDVYNAVAKVVNQKIYKETETKPEWKDIQNSIREILPTITRKIVKQPVMTTVYGVTRYGAKNQIAKQLTKIPAYENDKSKIMRHSVYITEKIFSSISDIFSSATVIQEWLGIVSNLIAKSVCIPAIAQLNEKTLKLNSVSTLMWTTPLGLRVVHPYRNESVVVVSTSLQSVKFSRVRPDSAVNVSKQSNAFPPNFIHSLDASHMLMTAVECTKQKIQFSAVHDSYWSLPGDSKNLSVILREKFVQMHSNDLLNALKQEFEKTYEQNVTLCRFSSNSPIADEIREYRYNFRLKYNHLPSLRDELTLESVRHALLNSPNEESRKKGENMVTVLSILESYSDEEIKSYAVVEKQQIKAATTISSVRAYLPLKFPEVPKKGEFEIRDVLGSKYFFS